MKLQVMRQTNAHLLIQILREHHAWKINYSTNKVQVSYFVELTQSNFPHKFPDLSLTSGLFPDFFLTSAEFPDISRYPEIPEKW